MSSVSVEKIKCPICEKELEVKIYNSINNRLDSGLKDKLLNGDLTDVYCDCGQLIELRYPILYHKMGFMGSKMIQYTQGSIKEECNLHQLTIDLFGANNPMVSLETYDDWDKFIERVKEIG